MPKSSLHVSITRRQFVYGLGLLGASAALGACSNPQAASSSSASAASAASTASAASAATPSPLLAIIYTNDTHGHDVEAEATNDAAGNFSMAAVAALKTEWEAKGYETLVVDAGDATQGMPLVDVDHGAPAIAFMNSCGYDLMTVGNHEFDWGTDNLAAIEEQAEFPLLSANILMKETGELRFEANKICELSTGFKVGFFGLTTPATETTTSPKHVEDFTFLAGADLFACAQMQVDELRKKGCDLVICVGHLGNMEANRDITSKAVLENVRGIDLFIDGHDHQQVEEEVAGTLLVETGCYLHNIGVVVIDEGVPSNQTVAYGTYDGIDKAAQAVIDAESARVAEKLGVVLGATAFRLDGERDPGVRTHETNLGDFCTDAFRWAAEQELGSTVDAAIINGGGIRISVEPGNISLMSIKSVIPYGNELAVLNVTGAQLLEALEAACQAVGGPNAIGSFPQVSGITFTIDASVPYEAGANYPNSTYASPVNPGARVTIADVGGRGFDKEATYAIAMTTFLCEGGDTYYAFKEAFDAEQPVTFGFDYEAIVSYLVVACDHAVPDSYAEPQGRITIVGL